MKVFVRKNNFPSFISELLFCYPRFSHEQLPTSELFENTKNDHKWKMCAKWLEDSFLFNEWMLEWDYQVNSKNDHIGPHKHPVFNAFKLGFFNGRKN